MFFFLQEMKFGVSQVKLLVLLHTLAAADQVILSNLSPKFAVFHSNFYSDLGRGQQKLY